MSTKKPTGAKGNPRKTDKPPADSAAAKKRKSAGFIETSGFKPNWLETGPLSPEMLPEDMQIEEGQLTPDEFETLQASLQRFYQQAEDEAPPADVESEPVADELKAPEDVESPLEAVADLVEPPIEAEAPAAVEEEQPDELLVVIEAEQLDEPPTARIEQPHEPSSIELEQPHEPPEAESEQPDESPAVVKSEQPEELLTADSEQPDEPPVIEVEPWIQPLLDGESVVATAPVSAAFSPGEMTAPVDAPMDEIDDAFVEEPLVIEGVEDDGSPVIAAAATEERSSRRGRTDRPKTRRRPDRLSVVLFLSSLILLGIAALVFFVNPFSRLALGSASLARPVSSPALAAPRAGSGEWCLTGDFLDGSTASPRLIDSGAAGDILAEDRVYSLEFTIPQPGTYEWQVVDCNDAGAAYPEAPAWITTDAANQPVTFIFDSNERADPLFFPIPYVVSALDATTDYRVIGSFQGWNPDDNSGELWRLNSGLYQQVRRIARAGSYEAYVTAGDENQAIDAYGRTTQPIPFSFQTDRNGEYVVFLLDTDRGRASVMYDMSPVLTSLAFGNGYSLLALALAGLAGLLFLGMLLRLIIMRNRRLKLESGCPRCGQQELMRIARRPSDRFLHWIGIPAYRYRCRNCTWEGMRLSEEGASISPGVSIAQFDGR